jgi:amino acid transporter/nucleotide-binding universal stress UspA family protein
MGMPENGRGKPAALALLSSERPRNVSWFQSGALLFGDWGTSRLYVLGLAFAVAGRTSFWLISAMSILILIVAWAYTQICRLYPDGGGVYTAARQRSKLLGVVGALLLFADYTVTASLSSLDAFHYFGLGRHEAAQVQQVDAGDAIVLAEDDESAKEKSTSAPVQNARSRWSWREPGVWAMLAIVAIGALNLLGPKHTAGFALAAAAGMVVITLLVIVCAIPQIDWRNIKFGRLDHPPFAMWQAFVSIVLALSGVEAIANLTGVMKRPVHATARKSIWFVAGEVAVFNVLLALAMCAIQQLPRDAHKEDMLAFMAGHYLGPWGEWPVRILGGLLLLSATNTAIGALMGTVYVMSRDAELPGVFQKLNDFGAPWVAAILATAVPTIVLLFATDLETLAHLYAIGIVGAVAISCTVSAVHPRLRRWWRKITMLSIGVLLIAIWITLALTKLHALIFVCIVLFVGLSLRQITRLAAQRRPKLSLLRQAIIEQLPEGAMARKKILLATAGSDQMADIAMEIAKAEHATLVVTFIRPVSLSYKVEAENRLNLDTDPAAQKLFGDFLEHGHRYEVPVIPMYDTGTNAPELIAEFAALNAVDRVLIGSSRRGAMHQLLKGSFQRRLESLLPPEIAVQVIAPTGR